MHNILAIYYSPASMGFAVGELSKEEEEEYCFRIRRYSNEAACLWAYAETPCTWSRILDDSIDLESWKQKALVHIRTNDLEWLEENFT